MFFNSSAIDPSFKSIFDNAVLASEIDEQSSAAATASFDQQRFACLRRLLVNFASPVSKNRRTNLPFRPLHLVAAHVNRCVGRPSMTSIFGNSWKNT
jgi:hypothetical protein